MVAQQYFIMILVLAVYSDMVFYTKQGTTAIPPVEVMRLDSSGNVGIGTDSPATTLHVAGGSSGDYIRTDAGINFSAVVAATAPTATLVAEAGNIDVGDHRYYVTFVTALGETEKGATSNTITCVGGQSEN